MSAIVLSQYVCFEYGLVTKTLLKEMTVLLPSHSKSAIISFSIPEMWELEGISG